MRIIKSLQNEQIKNLVDNNSGYEERIALLLQKYPLGEQIIGEQAKKDFIVSMGNILRLRKVKIFLIS